MSEMSQSIFRATPMTQPLVYFRRGADMAKKFDLIQRLGTYGFMLRHKRAQYIVVIAIIITMNVLQQRQATANPRTKPNSLDL